jgi:hypothetical protein
MKRLFALLFWLITGSSYAQTPTPTCNCPPNLSSPVAKKADTVFHLSNGRSIALCGGNDTIDGKTFYSEFVIAACGENHIIKFWSAVQLCQLRVIKDTLFAEEMVDLPTGKNRSVQYVVWTIEPIYFVKNKPVHAFKVNRKIRRYTPREIAATLSEYKHAKGQPNDTTMEIADKLFVSTISGSQKARTYLINFKKKFGPLDGLYAEWYDDVRRRLKLWETGIPSQEKF